MSQFRARISGQRGEVSRLGSKDSGIHADVCGWNSGVKVYGYVDEFGHDKFDVWATSGSSQVRSRILIGHVTIKDGLKFEPA